ncbi:DUF302 domain-containing protein [Breoghania sp.]|uniref:DUF302 domain-containing protein n=1 Tax=Breoghania sp. TaxID=2065378 RepID=UPI002AA73D93|nr:DUF302 domain-containing protein [Breoghania sp.]
MRFYIARTVDDTFDEVLARTKSALKSAGFEVVNELDLKNAQITKPDDETEKTARSSHARGVAYKLLMTHDESNVMLPCNIVVQQTDDGVEISAIDPEEEVGMVDKKRVTTLATPTRAKLEAALAAI